MKKLSLIPAFFILLTYSLLYTPSDGFDKEMGMRIISKVYTWLFDHDKYNEYKILRENYNNSNKVHTPENSTKIPHIIHQIWLGNSKIPQQYLYYNKTWKESHPKWELIIWTDKDLNKFSPEVRELISNARSYAEKVDILRLEILKQFGGVYVDMDTLSLYPIDETLNGFDFVAATAATDSSFEITNSLIASTPNHPILASALLYLSKNWKKIEDKFDTNSSLKTLHHLARNRTMFPLEFAVINYLKQHPDDHRIKVLPIDICNPFYKDANNFLNKTFRDGYHYSPTENTKCVHFNRKDYSLLRKQDFLSDVFEGSSFKKLIYKYITGNNIKNKMLEFSYDKNHPLNIEFSLQSRTPLTIHLIDSDKALSLTLHTLLKDHPDFKVRIWSEKDLAEFKTPSSSIEELFGLNIVNKYGGVYISGNSSAANLFEYADKYKFFAFIKKQPNLRSNLTLDSSLIGSSANQKIIQATLKDIGNKSITKDELESTLTDNYYKFWQIDGPVICLP